MIVISPDAVLDVERVRAFLDEKNANAAQKALSQIWSALERVQHFPNAGLRTSDPDIRQIIVRVGRAGYVARYAAMPNGDILVTRVWHSREQRFRNLRTSNLGR